MLLLPPLLAKPATGAMQGHMHAIHLHAHMHAMNTRLPGCPAARLPGCPAARLPGHTRICTPSISTRTCTP